MGSRATRFAETARGDILSIMLFTLLYATPSGAEKAIKYSYFLGLLTTLINELFDNARGTVIGHLNLIRFSNLTSNLNARNMKTLDVQIVIISLKSLGAILLNFSQAL